MCSFRNILISSMTKYMDNLFMSASPNWIPYGAPYEAHMKPHMALHMKLHKEIHVTSTWISILESQLDKETNPNCQM